MDLVLEGERRRVVPLASYTRLTILGLSAEEALRDPEAHAGLALGVASDPGSDLVLPLMDLTAEAEAFGAEVSFRGMEAPTVARGVGEDALESAEPPDPGSSGRLPLMVRAAELMASGSRVPVGFYLTGPFTLLGQLIGLVNALKMVRRDPGRVSSLMDPLVEFLRSYARALLGAGVDVLVMAEPSAGLISPGDFSRLVKPRVEEVLGVGGEWVLHVCGRSGHLVELLAQTGAVGLSFDHNVDLLEAHERAPGVLLFGNYSPVRLATRPEAEVRREVSALMERMAGVREFVLCTGCDVPYYAPPENLRAFVEVGRSYPQP